MPKRSLPLVKEIFLRGSKNFATDHGRALIAAPEGTSVELTVDGGEAKKGGRRRRIHATFGD